MHYESPLQIHRVWTPLHLTAEAGHFYLLYPKLRALHIVLASSFECSHLLSTYIQLQKKVNNINFPFPLRKHAYAKSCCLNSKLRLVNIILQHHLLKQHNKEEKTVTILSYTESHIVTVDRRTNGIFTTWMKSQLLTDANYASGFSTFWKSAKRMFLWEQRVLK